MWSTLGSRVVYENPWIRVREDAVERPDGTPGVYGVVEVRSPAVFVVAVTADDAVLLVTLDRPKANAVDVATSRELYEAFRRLHEDPALRVGVLTAAGDRFFSAGWDLKAAGDDNLPLLRKFNSIARQVQQHLGEAIRVAQQHGG
jgi:enoyl-CoA hydratase/carnithine racemase